MDESEHSRETTSHAHAINSPKSEPAMFQDSVEPPTCNAKRVRFTNRHPAAHDYVIEFAGVLAKEASTSPPDT
jgi:hypothetical protein